MPDSFDMRYGPWICMGCGMPHNLGEACPNEPEPSYPEAERECHYIDVDQVDASGCPLHSERESR